MSFPPLNLNAYREWVSRLTGPNLYQEEKNLRMVLETPGYSKEAISRASQKLEVIKEIAKRSHNGPGTMK